MAVTGFYRYELRTTELDAARVFYTDVFGSSFWDSAVSLAPLPERAAARGAPPHWLGYIRTVDISAVTARMVAEGGQQLGLVEPGAGNPVRTILRDPFGAVLAFDSDSVAGRGATAAWHAHHSEDHERSFALYAELFGWSSTGLLDLGPRLGRHRMFAWDETGPAVGSMGDTARVAQVHPQWLFFFEVPDLETALARVLAGGGKALEPTQNPNGDLTAPCDDPQGAAFGLYQSKNEARGRGGN